MVRKSCALIACLILAGFAEGLSAAEYCVSCSGPDASYRCAIADTPEGSPPDPRAQLLCITQLAENGGHETCSVMRNPVTPCEGPLTVIAAPLGPPLAPPPPPLAPEDRSAPPPVDASADGEPETKVPRTVEELAGQTVKSSKEGLKKAGDAIAGTAEKTGEVIAGTAKKAGEQIGNAGSAVGNAAKKTWNCLISLFSDC
jgi:hypothetical protein